MKRCVVMVAAVCSLGLSACKEQQEPVATQTEPAVEVAAPVATVDPEPLPQETPAAAKVVENAIPAILQGHWGMGKEDCDRSRADAKGSLDVTDKTLRYYESLGTLVRVTRQTPTSMQASFTFEGEGQVWDKEVSLEVRDGGQRLVHQEFGPDAIPHAENFFRCKS